MDTRPLVTCIMPTADRRAFVPQAIRCFLSQDYGPCELLIVDDGADAIADLVPADERIRYVRLQAPLSIGRKRNYACDMARGALIVHWDDDDWSAPWRVRAQAEALLTSDAAVCGVSHLWLYDPLVRRAWEYRYPEDGTRWVAGGTLCYRRDVWRHSPFPDVAAGEDTCFVRSLPPACVLPLADNRFYVATVHAHNTSPRQLGDPRFTPAAPEVVESLLGADRAAVAAACGGPHFSPRLNGIADMTDGPLTSSCAETSIFMVVHGALEMTRIAVLRTLRHSAASDARLVVVDNASRDGAREWLRLLAGRGDLDLIESPVNRGHGEGLELARAHTRSPYLVTLDSDAFPLSDDWLARLRAALEDGAAVAGILHHRGYIHPSCLMVARRTLDAYGLTFRHEKDQPSGLDVAERISVELRRRGHRLAGLECTKSRRPGSRSEPVFLGADYEGIVYHQWYTTRADGHPGRPVDDVPVEALEKSLSEVVEEANREPRDATIIVGLRVDKDSGARLRNARAALTALNFQDVARYRYRIVLVEQDSRSRAARELGPLVDRYLFVYNPGAYNRGWAFNVGAALAGPDGGPVCFMDADLLVPEDFVRRGLGELRRGARAVLPYSTVRYLDAEETDRAIAERLATPFSSPNPARFAGRCFTDSQGGALWIDARLYRQLGGHDERFRGWGAEDLEFHLRLERAGAAPSRLDLSLLHLDHPRPLESDPLARANQELLAHMRRHPAERAAGSFGDPDRYGAEARREADDIPGRRAWEHWNRWELQRIAAIVADEKSLDPATSARRVIAEMAARLGTRILDVGCGPGAMWPHLASHQPPLTCVGADVTAQMLSVARQWFPHVPGVQADAGQLPLSSGSFDVVVLRHVLEHLPEWLMKQCLDEAVRVARNAVIVGFYVPPTSAGSRHTSRVGEGFVETRWTTTDIEAVVRPHDWALRERHVATSSGADEVWVLAPRCLPDDVRTFGRPRLLSDESLKFSVITPTYRRNHCLNMTIATILAQTYVDWELIVVDNSGDCDIAVSDARITRHVHAEIHSASYARNRGLSYATGDAVCFFDDDDDMYPTYLERLAAAFRSQPSARMVRCGMIDGDGRVDYSYATPEVCLRRQYAEPTWAPDGPCQDQEYFRRIVSRHGWSEANGDIAVVTEPLCRANTNPAGGLRSGDF